MRNRIEDLGRISVLINLILNMKVLRIKENLELSLDQYLDWFFNQPRETQETMLMEISDIQGRLFEILSIADGLDPLNGGPSDWEIPPDSTFD